MKLKKIEDTFLWKVLIYAHRYLIAGMSFAIVLLITAAVIMRYIMKSDLYGLEEIEMLLALWIYFIGGSYGSYEGSHISADILPVFIKNKKVVWVIRIVVTIVSFVVSVFFMLWSLQYWHLIFMIGGHTTALKIPLVLQRMPLTIGFVLMMLFHFYHLVCAVIGREPVIIDADEDKVIEGPTKEGTGL